MNDKKLLERIDRKEFAAVVLDINDFKCEGIVTVHGVYTHELLRLARLGAARQWIPISERLPEDGAYVLGWWHSESKLSMYICMYHSLGRQFRPGISMPPYPVTHWMPLPEPPEEG